MKFNKDKSHNAWHTLEISHKYGHMLEAMDFMQV
jgi:hypothetical protein